MRRALFLVACALLVCAYSPSTISTAAPAASPAAPSPESITATATPSPAPVVRGVSRPTSDELIRSALAAGRLDAETALVYRVFAAFGDPRLPAEYRGDDSSLVDTHILDEVQARWERLSPSAQRTLRPFLTPPIYKGSWYDLRRSGASQGSTTRSPAPLPSFLLASYDPSLPSSIPATARGALSLGVAAEDFKPLCAEIDRLAWASDVGRVAHVKIWWPREQVGMSVTAQKLLDALDTVIWPKLTGLMGQPLRDGDARCGGDDSRLDIYLTGKGGRSYAPQLSPPGCRQTAAYIEMASDSVDVLAHEFMHTIQWGYRTAKDCVYSPNEYAWLAEATAMWAADFVYPTHNWEHKWAGSYLYRTHERLRLADSNHEYGAYLLPLFLVKTQSPKSVRAIWDNTQAMGALEAVDRVLPGGYKGNWPQFTRSLWNRAPYDDYKAWDGLPIGAGMAVDLRVRPDKLVQSYDIGPRQMDALTARYYRVTFDPGVHWVAFYNGLSHKVALKEVVKGGMGYAAEPASDEQKKGAMVQALIRINDTWRHEDWTGRDAVSFCRDKKEERIQELVLIYGNTAYEPADYVLRAAGESPTLVASKIGCWQWQGSVYAQQVEDGTTWTLNATDLLFERSDTGAGIGVGYTLKRGNLQWNVSSEDSCGPRGAGTIPLAPVKAGDGAVMNSFNGIVSGSLYGHLGAATWNRRAIKWDECGDGVTAPQPFNWGVMNVAQRGLNPDGSLSATYTLPVDEGPQWTWDLRPVAEP